MKERLEFLRTGNTKKILLSSNYRKGMDLNLLLIQQSRKLTPQIQNMTESVFCFETENKDYNFAQLHNLTDFKQQTTNKYSSKLSWLKRKQQRKFTVTVPNNIATASKLAKKITELNIEKEKL